MARHTTTPPYKREQSALAWLNAPRTSGQIAELIGVTPNHASALLRRLWLRGKAERSPSPRRGGVFYRYVRVDP